MAEIHDRHGRTVEMLLSGRGQVRKLGRAGLEAALLIRRSIFNPSLASPAYARLLGFIPEKAELRLGGSRLFFNIPADLGAFLSDMHGIILRDQYAASGRVGGGTVIDAGANIGLFSIYALALGARKVFAFEAVAETFRLLEANLALNGAGGRVKAVNAALGAAKGRAELKFNTRGEGSAMIGGEDTINSAITYSGRRMVDVLPLDSLVKGRAGFIKADVEGYEKEVLLGAARLIRRCRPVLSLAAYHRAGDAKTLRSALSSLRPGYKTRLNKFVEHDLYCEYKGA